MNRRRVVHFVDSEVFGGAEQAILTLFEGLDSTRWELVLAHSPSPELAPLVNGARALGVETWAVPRMAPGLEGLRRVPGFTSALRRRRAAVVHLHLTWPLDCQYALIGAVLARVPAVRRFAQHASADGRRVQESGRQAHRLGRSEGLRIAGQRAKGT